MIEKMCKEIFPFAAHKFESRSGFLKAAPAVIAGSGILMQFFLGILKLKHFVSHLLLLLNNYLDIERW